MTRQRGPFDDRGQVLPGQPDPHRPAEADQGYHPHDSYPADHYPAGSHAGGQPGYAPHAPGPGAPHQPSQQYPASFEAGHDPQNWSHDGHAPGHAYDGQALGGMPTAASHMGYDPHAAGGHHQAPGRLTDRLGAGETGDYGTNPPGFGHEPGFEQAPGYAHAGHPAFPHDPGRQEPGFGQEPGFASQAQGYAEPHFEPTLRGPAYDEPAGGYAPVDGGQPLDAYDLNSYRGPAAPMGSDGADGYPQFNDGFQPGPFAEDNRGAVATTDDEASDYYDDEDDEDEPRGERSRLIVGVAGLLIASVALGGGLAYGYKTFLAGASSEEAGPIVRAPAGPTGTAPQTGSGQRFANTDSKLLDRLDAGRGVPKPNDRPPRASTGSSAERTGSSNDRVRSVSTHVVRPDGSIVTERRAAPPARPATTSAPQARSPIPGMTIVGLNDSPPTAPAAAQPARPAIVGGVPRTPTPPATSANRPPVVIANAAPTQPRRPAVSTQPAVTRAPASAGVPSSVPLPPRNTFPRVARAAPVRPPAAAPRAPTQPAVVTPRVPAAPASTASTGLGYVAVLASRPSRMDALKAFADLRQQYSGVLASSIPDVQEADLSSRGLGTMYRVVVGPPGSRASANELCGRLKTAGYDGCWIKAY